LRAFAWPSTETRFMERGHLQKSDVRWGHEPERGLGRCASLWSAVTSEATSPLSRSQRRRLSNGSARGPRSKAATALRFVAALQTRAPDSLVHGKPAPPRVLSSVPLLRFSRPFVCLAGDVFAGEALRVSSG